jgi:hypothetical protein
MIIDPAEYVAPSKAKQTQGSMLLMDYLEIYAGARYPGWRIRRAKRWIKGIIHGKK